MMSEKEHFTVRFICSKNILYSIKCTNVYVQTLSAKLLINNFLIGTPSSVTGEKNGTSAIENEKHEKYNNIKAHELTKQFIFYYWSLL